MIQINNGFKDYYYIDSEYEVFNSKSQRYLRVDSGGSYSLIKEDGKRYHVSRNTLLKLVFGSNFVLKDIDNLPNEEWKQINSSHYFCSSLGRIKSMQLLSAKLLTTDKSTGYERIKIDIGNGLKHYLVHKLVAIYFLEPPTEAFMEIHHINNDKLCNKAQNLVFLSHEDHVEVHKELRRKEKENEQEKNTNN